MKWNIALIYVPDMLKEQSIKQQKTVYCLMQCNNILKHWFFQLKITSNYNKIKIETRIDEKVSKSNTADVVCLNSKINQKLRCVMKETNILCFVYLLDYCNRV